MGAGGFLSSSYYLYMEIMRVSAEGKIRYYAINEDGL